MRFNGNIALLLVASLAGLVLASPLPNDSSVTLVLLAGAAGIFILNDHQIVILPSGRISGRMVPVLLIRKSLA